MKTSPELDILYLVCADLSDDALNGLSLACWPGDMPQQYGQVLAHSLLFVSAHVGGLLVGFVNIAWDGGEHGFLLDTRVHPDFRHRGIGTGLVKRAVSEAGARDLKWVHVDFEPHLKKFYADCGFFDTEAGLVRLR